MTKPNSRGPVPAGPDGGGAITPRYCHTVPGPATGVLIRIVVPLRIGDAGFELDAYRSRTSRSPRLTGGRGGEGLRGRAAKARSPGPHRQSPPPTIQGAAIAPLHKSRTPGPVSVPVLYAKGCIGTPADTLRDCWTVRMQRPLTDVDLATTPPPMRRSARRRMKRQQDIIVTVHRLYGFGGRGMSFGQLATLFRLPKTTVWRMVKRGEKADEEEIQRAAYDWGLRRFDFTGTSTEPPERTRALASLLADNNGKGERSSPK